MKTVYSILPLAASAFVLDMPAAVGKKGPGGEVDYSNFIEKLGYMKTYKGVVVDKIRLPSLRNDTIHKAIRYGPFTVPSQLDPLPKKSLLSAFIPPEKGELNALGGVNALCTDCFVIRSTTYMEYENGTMATPLTGIYNHHAVVFQSKQQPMAVSCKTKSFSRGAQAPSIFAASAADGGSIEALTKVYPQDYSNAVARGLYTRPGTKMNLLAQLMNYRDERQKLYIVAEAEYFNGKPEGFMESSGVSISVTGCDLKIDFTLPASGKFYKESPEFVVPKDVQLVSMNGHMHDGGDKMELLINGKVACDSKAVYGIDGQILTDQNGKTASSIVGMKPCVEPRMLKKGDKLSVKAYYDSSIHPMRMSNSGGEETVMGLGIFEFALPIGAAYP